MIWITIKFYFKICVIKTEDFPFNFICLFILTYDVPSKNFKSLFKWKKNGNKKCINNNFRIVGGSEMQHTIYKNGKVRKFVAYSISSFHFLDYVSKIIIMLLIIIYYTKIVWKWSLEYLVHICRILIKIFGEKGIPLSN